MKIESQFVAMCCSELQRNAVFCSVLLSLLGKTRMKMECQIVAMCCSMLQYVAVHCSVPLSLLEKIRPRTKMLQHVVACFSVLQCVAVCCCQFWKKLTKRSKCQFVAM